MSLEKVKEYFKAYGIEDRIIELSESSAQSNLPLTHFTPSLAE